MAEKSALKSVIVIGAGISGLSAAKRLINHGGFFVTALEASDRIGGRIHSAEFGANTVEIGAQWVHGESGNRIFEIANAHGLLHIERTDKHKKFAETSIFVTQDGKFLKEGIHDKIAKLIEILHEESSDKENSEADKEDFRHPSLSLEDAATQAFWGLNEETCFHENDGTCAQILDWLHRFQNSIDGADHWGNTSFIGQSEYKQCDGNPTISWKNPENYSSLLEIILNSDDDFMICNLEELKDKYSSSNIPSWIKLGKEVTTVQYSSNEEAPVSTLCKDGSEYKSDYVISTISLGVLKDCHTTLFKPALPRQKVNAIEHIAFGTVDKIFLEFDHQWWPAECDGFNLLWDSSSKENWSPTATAEDLNKIDEHSRLPVWARSLLGFYVVSFQPNVLVTWITGEPARHMEKLDLEELKQILFSVLKKFTGRMFNVPEPLRIKRSTWYTYPYSRGSYSYRQMSTESNDVWAVHLAEPILRDDQPILCFAGEATHSSFYSTVHGGFESGVREADRIIAHAYGK